MEVLKGIEVAKAINEEIAAEIKRSGIKKKPHLAIIRVGERPDDMAYERGAIKKMEKVGFIYSTFTYSADFSNRVFYFIVKDPYCIFVYLYYLIIFCKACFVYRFIRCGYSETEKHHAKNYNGGYCKRAQKGLSHFLSTQAVAERN